MKFRFSWRWILALSMRILGKATPESIAKGAALGLFVAFAIPIGFQLAVVIPAALYWKAERVSAITMTFVTNHFTVLIIYPAQCYLGGLLIGNDLSIAALKEQFGTIVTDFTWKRLLGLGGEVVGSFFVGGVALGIVSAVIGYPIALYAARRFQRTREALKAAKIAKRRKRNLV